MHQQVLRTALLAVACLSLLSACSRMAGATSPATAFPATTAANAQIQTTNPVVRNAPTATDISAYLPSAAFSQMSDKDKTEASSAQYYALQTGRPGAPRRWSGDAGAAGKITVGPFIRVNTLDCREFEHEVTISGQAHTQAGTSCREADGKWTVVAF